MRMGVRATITANERIDLFERALLPDDHPPITGPVLLAVSGGPDSMAMLWLAAENRSEFRRIGVEVHVATVDHRLRPASAEEAEGVAQACGALGLPHRILGWDGPKPASNLQGAARRARYGLLQGAASTVGASAILTAHHEDDQIETHELARERHAGDRGRAGMRERRALSLGLDLVRPFLGVSGARMRATGEASGLILVDDPSNDDVAYARVRLRKAMAGWEEGRRTRRLAEIAGHRAAVGRTDRAIAAALMRGGARCDDLGRIQIEADGIVCAPSEVRAELLGRLIVAVTGAEHAPARDALDRAIDVLLRGGRRVATLGGARLDSDGRLVVSREYGRQGPSAVPFETVRSRVMFDGRFVVSLQASQGPDDAPLEKARLVPFGHMERGNSWELTMPVLVSSTGEPLAAPIALSGKMPELWGRLCIESLVPWRLWADLPRDEGA